MRTLLLFMFFLLSIYLNAQWSASLRNGLTVSNITTNKVHYFYTDNLVSYLPELSINYSIKKISINTAVSYIQLGFKKRTGGISPYSSVYGLSPEIYKWNYSYLSVPIYASYRLFENKSVYFNPVLGFNFDIKTDATAYANVYYAINGVSYYATKVQKSGIETANNIVPNLLLGGSFGYKLNEKLSLDVNYRYNLGLMEFDNSDEFNNKMLNFSSFLFGLNYKW